MEKFNIKNKISEGSIYFFCVLVISIFFSSTSFAQLYTDKDVEICKSKYKLAVDEKLAELPIGDVIAEVGKSFLGTQYEPFAIERDGDEQLVVHLTGLDCTTFLENTLTFARLIKQGKSLFRDYVKELTNIRYRDGVVDKYPSRLHYFSDWIYNNIEKGIVEDVTKELNSKPIRFNLNFMSTHPEGYKQLQSNPRFISTIREQERSISSREYYYIPKERVSYAEGSIQNGDLIAITTNIKGLDIGHVGIAVKGDDGRIYFMHAPLVGSEVQISKEPLPAYLAKIKKHTGIIVLRLLEP